VAKKKDIPIHQLKERASSGLQMVRYDLGDLESGEDEEDESFGAHRDDHYLFFLMEEGEAALMIDFQEMRFVPNTLYYVLPGQVHHRIRSTSAVGWFLAVDTLLVPPDYRKIFENQLLLQKPYLLTPVQMEERKTLLHLLLERYNGDEQSTFYLPLMHSLLQSFIGLVAVCYAGANNPNLKISRPMELSQQFKKLLADQVQTEKSPSAYAAMLNVSETYLNEALKKTTGLSVSYWILNEVMLEAKRMLYYSDQNVKQIAHNLGYEDHAYFSRLFKKAEGTTPLTFRGCYHK
jgi:AraC family transcriptional activator of pobA